MNEVMNCLLERRSCRKYLPKQVEDEALQQILLAGTYAPSGMARQPVKIVVLQDPEAIAELEAMNAAIMGNADGHPFYGAPTVCVVLYDTEVYTGLEDASLVMGNMMNAAHSLGVASCWIHRAKQEFDSPEGKALLRKWGIPETYTGCGHCILGYADGPCRPAVPRKADYIIRP